MISTDIEQWYYEPSLTDQEIEQRFDTLFSYFRQNISPNITIGNYGAAPTALCVHRYYHPKMSEDSILMTWRKAIKTLGCTQICRCSSTLSLHCRA